MIRVLLPAHLRHLAGVSGEVALAIDGPATVQAILDTLEAQYPVLRGTIRDHASLERRPFVRFFVGGEDWSHAAAHTPLPAAVANGSEPFMIVGAMAGG